MSSTKIVIIVLILVAVIFAIFVATGAFSSEPKSKSSNQAAKDFTKNPPAWTKAIKRFIGSRQPKLTLKRGRYTSSTTEEVPPDEENPFRTATFHLISGSATINYEDRTDEAEDMELDEQKFNLPNFDNEKDIRRGSIVALKKGGTLTITCEGTSGCTIDVEK